MFKLKVVRLRARIELKFNCLFRENILSITLSNTGISCCGLSAIYCSSRVRQSKLPSPKEQKTSSIVTPKPSRVKT